MRYLLVLLIIFSVGCSRVPAGNVGVKVFLLGGDKGVDSVELSPGRYWVGVNEELHVFPTFTQNYVWTKDPAESSPNDESFTFQTVEGLSVNADIGISYRIKPDKVTDIFQKYRKGVDEITDIYIRNMVRDSLVRMSSSLPVESVYGSGKSKLMDDVEKDVRDSVEGIGIIIEKIYWIGELRLPGQVIRSINAKIEATQKAQQRINEVAQSKAEADKEIEKARGIAESKLTVARAEAKSIALQGEALRKNPEVLKLRAIERWDGILPKFTGEVIPIIDIDKVK